MRSKLRASVIAVSMVSIMAFSVTGCASQKTNEFAESEQSGQAVSAMSSSVTISDDEPEIIDNSGKFTYAANSSRYSASIAGGTQTGLTCVGYTVYQDETGQYFVVSGDERIDLENNEKILEHFHGNQISVKTTKEQSLNAPSNPISGAKWSPIAEEIAP